MKITIRGELTFHQVLQALYEVLHQIEHDHAIDHSRGATLYINPTDGLGRDVIPRHESGEEVRELHKRGPYRSAADDYKI